MGEIQAAFIEREVYHDCPECDGPMLVVEYSSGYVRAKCESCGHEWDDSPKEE